MTMDCATSMPFMPATILMLFGQKIEMEDMYA